LTHTVKVLEACFRLLHVMMVKLTSTSSLDTQQIVQRSKIAYALFSWRISEVVEFSGSYQLIKSIGKVPFMQSSSRIRSVDIKNWNIVRNDSVEQKSDFEPCSWISRRRIRFTMELDPQPFLNRRSHQPRTTERWEVSCVVTHTTAT